MWTPLIFLLFLISAASPPVEAEEITKNFVLRVNLHVDKVHELYGTEPSILKDLLKFVNDVLRKETGIHLQILTSSQTNFSSSDINQTDAVGYLYEVYKMVKDKYHVSQKGESVELHLVPVNQTLESHEIMTGWSSPPWEVLKSGDIYKPYEEVLHPLIVVTYNQTIGVQHVGYNIVSRILHVLGFDGNDYDELEISEHSMMNGTLYPRVTGYGCKCPTDSKGSLTEACILVGEWETRNRVTKNTIQKARFPGCVQRLIQSSYIPYLFNLSDAIATESEVSICGNGITEFDEISDKGCLCDCPTPPHANGDNPDDHSNKPLSKSSFWTVFAVVVGLLTLLVVIVLLLLFFRKKMNKKTLLVTPVRSPGEVEAPAVNSPATPAAGLFVPAPAAVPGSRAYTLNASGATLAKYQPLRSVPIPAVVLTTNPVGSPVPSSGSSSAKYAMNASGATKTKDTKSTAKPAALALSPASSVVKQVPASTTAVKAVSPSKISPAAKIAAPHVAPVVKMTQLPSPKVLKAGPLISGSPAAGGQSEEKPARRRTF